MITERQLEVILSVVYEYIKSGETVGSRTVSRRYLTGRSSATIRNEMSDLEDMGFLQQTHASSGRIPTTRGYRIYVDSIMQRLGGLSVERLTKMMSDRQVLGKTLEKASEMLSEVSDYVGIAAITPLDTVRFHHATFVRMGERKVLMLVVLQGGLVHEKLIELPVDMEQKNLDEAAACINAFSGYAWHEIKQHIKHKLAEELEKYREACFAATDEIDKMLGEHRTKIFTGSFSHIMKSQDFQDLGRIHTLCSFLEEEDNMVNLINRCSANEMNVMIGDENGVAGMENSSLVAAVSETNGQKAVVGIIGPKRMNYEHAINAIDGVLDSLDKGE